MDRAMTSGAGGATEAQSGDNAVLGEFRVVSLEGLSMLSMQKIMQVCMRDEFGPLELAASSDKQRDSEPANPREMFDLLSLIADPGSIFRLRCAGCKKLAASLFAALDELEFIEYQAS